MLVASVVAVVVPADVEVIEAPDIEAPEDEAVVVDESVAVIEADPPIESEDPDDESSAGHPVIVSAARAAEAARIPNGRDGLVVPQCGHADSSARKRSWQSRQGMSFEDIVQLPVSGSRVGANAPSLRRIPR